MSTESSEPQLADNARIALLEGIAKAAKAGRGDEARALAEAYAIVNTVAPGEKQEPGEESPWLNPDAHEIVRGPGRSPLQGRR